MSRPLRVAIADDEPCLRTFFEELVRQIGHQVVVSARNGRELVERCQAESPDLIITDIHMPELDGIEAAKILFAARPVPIIFVSAFDEPEVIDRACTSQALAYLVKPIRVGDLDASIAMAIHRFREFEALHQEVAKLRQELENRKVIEQAKGLLMKRASLDEQEAFQRLQKLARNKNRKLVEVAQMILTTEELLAPSQAPCAAEIG
jgi:response regulator NasT